MAKFVFRAKITRNTTIYILVLTLVKISQDC